MKKKKIAIISLDGGKGFIDIGWAMDGKGFGHTTFAIDRRGNVSCEDDAMGMYFVGALLKSLSDSVDEEGK